MDYSYNIYCSAGDSENSPIVAVYEMAVLLIPKVFFWYQRTSSGKPPQGIELTFKSVNEPVGLVYAVVSDECPDLIHVRVCSLG